jgi:hypothetical protein
MAPLHQRNPTMTIQSPASLLAIAAALVLSVAASAASAQTAPTKPAKASKKAAAKKVAEPAPPPEADADQIAAADKVYYGKYDCEFKMSVNIDRNAKYPSYVDVKFEKADYLMKPVLSSTGAIRLEDVRGETLMVQISSKSMLLNVKTGHRLVDDCVSPKQHELIDAAREAKTTGAASAAAPSTAPAMAKTELPASAPK